MPVIVFGGMDCHFCRRQREDQPSMASVHGRESEDVPQEGAVSRRIFTVQDHMRTKDNKLYPLPAIIRDKREVPLGRPPVQFIGEVQQEGHVKVALGLLDIRTRENREAFAVRMQVENPDKVRLEHLPVRPHSRLRRSKRVSIDRVIAEWFRAELKKDLA